MALSYVHGASDVPLIGETIGVQFDRAAARWADRPALIVREQGVRWTYAELQAQVDAFAAGLLALGLEPGDRVGIWSPNNAEWVVTQFATAKAGPDPGQHQPGLPHPRAGLRAEQGRLPGAGHRPPASRPATISPCCASWRPSSPPPPGPAAGSAGCPRSRP